MTDMPELQAVLLDAARRRRRLRRSRRVAAAAALPLAALVAVLALSPSVPEREREAPAPSAKPATPTRVEDAYGVLRRPARRVDRFAGEQPGDVSRRIAATPTINVFLVLRGNDLCLVTATKQNRMGGMGCGPASTYLDGRRPIGSFSDEEGPSTLVSVFPDGVAEATVTLADGSTVTRPVKDNTFALDVPARPTKLQWTAPDGRPQQNEYHAAPGFKASDFYSVLKRPEQPGDALDGLPGARRLLNLEDATAWLVPRKSAVCLVLDVDGRRASGCRHKVGDVRFPLVVALAGTPERIVAAAFPDAAEHIQVLPAVRSARSSNALIIAQGQTAQRLRWKISSPDPPRTETLPPGDAGFVLHARAESPSSIP
ncbi:hypothetical protein OM076_00080 [Solirubrobacter ginsenosidimutans]|uniref:Uncharacterized protein n=1 Tax=Solirubrobacter ginsenosidimutans TaxID=490573 RepID=A0A9X3MP40_9ACTN|nr:hypothetical protein [Solirubrobacter ginsenosidimutans]MDA0158643.1 hypothetical protein [Solirubrobacter ginsenosidimutans]